MLFSIPSSAIALQLYIVRSVENLQCHSGETVVPLELLFLLAISLLRFVIVRRFRLRISLHSPKCRDVNSGFHLMVYIFSSPSSLTSTPMAFVSIWASFKLSTCNTCGSPWIIIWCIPGLTVIVSMPSPFSTWRVERQRRELDYLIGNGKWVCLLLMMLVLPIQT